eukprot:363073-Chlamydomonas_euryale.AAC.1
MRPPSTTPLQGAPVRAARMPLLWTIAIQGSVVQRVAEQGQCATSAVVDQVVHHKCDVATLDGQMDESVLRGLKQAAQRSAPEGLCGHATLTAASHT